MNFSYIWINLILIAGRKVVRVLSGIQPSGALHLGNYFAMMKRMIEFQENHELFCFIVNYHALTSVREPELLRKNTFEACVDFLALGIDPEKSYFYVQSDIPEVTELTWILSSITEMGLLQRSHSYKDKIDKGIEASHGGQQRGFSLADQVAQIDEIAADTAADGCFYPGVAQVQTGPLDFGLGAGFGSSGNIALSAPLHNLGLGTGLLLEKLLGAVQFDSGPLQLGLGAFHLRLGGMELCLVFPGIDDEKQIPPLDRFTGSEVHALEEAGHPGPDFRLFERPRGAGKLQILDDLLLQGLGNGHLGQWRRHVLVSLVTAVTHQGGQNNGGQRRPSSPG